MKISRLALSSLTIQLFWLVTGCCIEETEAPFRWTRMDVENLNNSGPAPIFSYGSPVPAAAYGISMIFTLDRNLASRYLLLPAAYATSCPGMFVDVNVDTVLSVRVHAIPSDSAEAVHDVTNEFRATRRGAGGIGPVLIDLVTIDEMVRGMNRNEWTWIEGTQLLRMENLDRSPGIRFGVTVELKGGRTLSDTTAPLTLI